MSDISVISEIVSIDDISTTLKRRLRRECETMIPKYDEIKVEYKSNTEILVVVTKKRNIYTFNIPLNYPFSVPDVNLNGKNIYTFFDLRSNRFKKVLKYITGMDCLCCNSFLCRDNWSPSITIDKIINQIEEYHNIKHLIISKLLMDKIKYKYLNRDIDLDSWLFNISNRDVCVPGNSIH